MSDLQTIRAERDQCTFTKIDTFERKVLFTTVKTTFSFLKLMCFSTENQGGKEVGLSSLFANVLIHVNICSIYTCQFQTCEKRSGVLYWILTDARVGKNVLALCINKI